MLAQPMPAYNRIDTTQFVMDDDDTMSGIRSTAATTTRCGNNGAPTTITSGAEKSWASTRPSNVERDEADPLAG
jgi:hypothetical protein